MNVLAHILSPSVVRGIAAVCAAILIASMASSARAAGVVGTGTAQSCTHAALDTALADGGLVTFDCGPDPVTIDISTGTGTKTIATDATIDGGGLITIGRGNNVVVFSVNPGVTFTVENLTTIAYGSEFDDQPGGISNDGTLLVTNSTFTSSGTSSCGIANDGTLIVTSSTFPSGGCIVNQHGSATVINSTFADNSGGIYNGGTLIVTTSTFSNSGAIHNSGTLTVTDCTLSGNLGYLGGAISNEGGTLTVTNSIFSANRTSGVDSLNGGGAIANHNGTVSVSNSTFSANSTLFGGPGGAIFNASDGSSAILTITNCTFSGNGAPSGLGEVPGGAIFNAGTLTVTNSTFSGNASGRGGTGGDSGGAIENFSGTASVGNSTFSGNDGGAIGNGDTLTVTNTIVANSPGSNCSGSVTDGGHNIEDGTTCGFSGTSLSNTNPMLDPTGLANNGGPTQTIALLAGSPAINAGDPDVCANPPVNGVDQRGYVRPGDGATSCSIGAYEFNSSGPPPATSTATPSASPTPTGTPASSATPSASPTLSPSFTTTATLTVTATLTPKASPTATQPQPNTATPTLVPVVTATAPPSGGGGCASTPTGGGSTGWWLLVSTLLLAHRSRAARRRGRDV